MEPRLVSSIKWTHLPVDLKGQILDTFNKAYADSLPGHQWYTEGLIYPEEVMFRVGYGLPKSLSQSHFYLSWTRQEGSNILEQVHQAVDALDHIIQEYISSGPAKTDLPRVWKPIQTAFKAKDLHFCFSTENFDLEAQANALLGDDFDAPLTGGNWDQDDEDPSGNKGHLH